MINDLINYDQTHFELQMYCVIIYSYIICIQYNIYIYYYNL